MYCRPPRSTLLYTLLPFPTLFRSAATGGVHDGDAECQPEQVIGLVHRAVTTARSRVEPVFAEAARRVSGRRFEHDINAPAKVAEHGPAVALDAGNDLDGTLVRQRPAVGARPKDVRQVEIGRASCGESVCQYV